MALPETPSRGVDLADPTTLIRLGYWHRAASMAAGPVGDPWPKPQDMVDEGWDASERPGAAGYLDRDGVASYLERGFIARAYMGLSPCRLCGQNNGCLELTDGTFLWPEGLAHYVRDHAVRVRRIQRVQDCDVSDSQSASTSAVITTSGPSPAD
jgi:hypothetical protein